MDAQLPPAGEADAERCLVADPEVDGASHAILEHELARVDH